MVDKRWEPDTLFLIFEEDYRFESGCDREPVLVPVAQLQEVVGEAPVALPQGDAPRVPLGFRNPVAVLG